VAKEEAFAVAAGEDEVVPPCEGGYGWDDLASDILEEAYWGRSKVGTACPVSE
jgi:hypothetical protein